MTNYISKETKVYGVSTGNGNDGVSHIYASYYVRTNDPWELAKRAVIDHFSNTKRHWVEDVVEIEGGDEQVSATIYEGPEGETEFGAAWFILDVFLEDDEDWLIKRIEGLTPVYDSIEAAFGEDKC